MSPRARTAAPLVAILLAACSAPASSGRGNAESAVALPARGESAAAPASSPPVVGGPAADTGSGDQARIARLEREARALARTTGCTSADACRTAPVGVRACGGPRDYIVYCAATTDSAALFRKLSELASLERSVNERSGMMSTCEFRSPPEVAATGGSCRQAPAGGTGAP